MSDQTSPTHTLTTQAASAREALGASLSVAKTRATYLGTLTTANIEYFRRWRSKYTDTYPPNDAIFEHLWGAQGLTNVRKILTTIIDASHSQETQLTKTQKPHAKWHFPSKFLQTKKPAPPSLKSIVDVQKDAIMSLSIYSDTVLYSRHNVKATEASRDAWLTAALRSRIGSLQLYNLTVKANRELCLGLDLLPVSSEETNAANSLPQDDVRIRANYEVPACISFKLFTEVQEDGAEIQTIVIDNLIEEQLHGYVDEIVISIDAVALPISVRDTELSIIPDQIQHSTSLSHLRILKSSITHLNLSSPPTPLITSSSNPPPHPRHRAHCPSASQINLAYTFARNALFLLGTPWLGLLNSRFLLQYKPPNQQEYNVLFPVFHLEPDDLYKADPSALLESSQLFHIGLLLLHIALPITPTPLPTPLADNDEELIALLPQVEKAMREQYCRAMAFCLVYRRPHEDYRSAMKYSSERYGRWMEYLTEFWEGFYKKVFLPLKVLREIHGDDAE